MNETLEYLKWQVVLSMKRTIVDVEYRYNLNLKMIKNMRLDDLFDGIKIREAENEHLLKIKEETMYELISTFGISSFEKIDEYLFRYFEKIMNLISSNPELYELNLDCYFNISKKNINDYDFINMLRILKKQKEYFKSNYIGFSDTIYKDLLYIINCGDYSLTELYNEVISNEFFNPNIGGCGTSNEKFWCRLPNINCGIKNIIQLNRKVILDKRTNYHLLSNGMAYINVYAEKALSKSESSLSEKLYYFNTISDAIKLNNCNILDTYFIDGSKQFEDNRFIKNILFGDYQVELIGLVNDLRDYLLSNEGLERQIAESGLSTIKRNESIDIYISAFNESKNVSKELVHKLKSMKM